MQNKKMLPLTDRRALVVYLQEMRYRRIAFQERQFVPAVSGGELLADGVLYDEMELNNGN